MCSYLPRSYNTSIQYLQICFSQVLALNCMTDIYFDAHKHNKNVYNKKIQLAIPKRNAIRI